MAGVVLRSAVPERSNYAAYREELRFDFWYSCAYCSMTEVEACGIGFQIDHYVPQTEDPNLKNVYSNLMWSCTTCNRYKSGIQTEETNGLRFFRPDADNPHDHFTVVDIETIKPSTPIGEFTVTLLLLNRATLRKIRAIRHRIYKSKRCIIDGLRALQRTRIDRLNPEQRRKFVWLRQRYKDSAKALSKAEEEALLRLVNRSDLIDPDPDKTRQVRTRRKYLDEIGAIGTGRRWEVVERSKRAKRKRKSKK